jgi:hypothetical protein
VRYGVVTDLDAAVVLAKGLDLRDLDGRRGFEIAFDVGMERRLVILDGQKVVGLGVENRLGDVGIASHGIDRDQGALKVEALDEGRNGGDLVRFFIDRLLAQHQTLVAGEGRDQMQALWPVLRLWLRREVLPSIATRSSWPGQHASTHDEKQARNKSGLMRFITQRSQSANGMP